MKRSKRMIDGLKSIDVNKKYSFSQGIEILKNFNNVSFDESVDLSVRLSVDPTKADQQVRNIVKLPNGSGRKVKILVFASGQKAEEAKRVGADFVGGDELIEKVSGGWVDFTQVISTPDMMSKVGRLGKVLGPRGLMPSPRFGSVTQDVAKAVKDIRMGQVTFKSDRSGTINTICGKLSFSSEKLEENFLALMDVVIHNKPDSVKGNFIKSVRLSSTMGPGLSLSMEGVS